MNRERGDICVGFPVEIIPAIDLRAGKVVRLLKGEFTQESTYSSEPIKVADNFARAGVDWIHIVDLDGARYGSLSNMPVYHEIIEKLAVPVQVGGGIRSLQAVEAVLNGGVERVVLGTAAAFQPEVIKEIVLRFGSERVIVGLDVRDGWIAVEGWTQSTAIDPKSIIDNMKEFEISRFIFTDIERDGTLTQPNFDAIDDIVRFGAGDLNIIASGGVGTLDHLRTLSSIGVEAAILGKAIYAGYINLVEAVELVRKL